MYQATARTLNTATPSMDVEPPHGTQVLVQGDANVLVTVYEVGERGNPAPFAVDLRIYSLLFEQPYWRISRLHIERLSGTANVSVLAH